MDIMMMVMRMWTLVWIDFQIHSAGSPSKKDHLNNIFSHTEKNLINIKHFLNSGKEATPGLPEATLSALELFSDFTFWCVYYSTHFPTSVMTLQKSSILQNHTFPWPSGQEEK